MRLRDTLPQQFFLHKFDLAARPDHADIRSRTPLQSRHNLGIEAMPPCDNHGVGIGMHQHSVFKHRTEGATDRSPPRNILCVRKLLPLIPNGHLKTGKRCQPRQSLAHMPGAKNNDFLFRYKPLKIDACRSSAGSPLRAGTR